jgi:hypothetical protein
MSLLSRRLDPAVVVDVVVSCSVAALATWWWHQFRLGGLVYGGLVGVVLLWRRRRPLVVLGVVAALSTVVAPIEVNGTTMHEGLLLVSLAVAAYAVVAYGRTILAAVSGGVAALLAAALLVEGRPSPGQDWSPIGLMDLFAAIGSLLGPSVHTARPRLRNS